MRAFCSGFNLYGQFVKFPEIILNSFVVCSYGDEIEDVVFSHTFSVAFKGSNVFLHGSKAGKKGQTQKIHLPDGVNVSQIACSDQRILFLTENGLLYKYDLNSDTDLCPKLSPNFLGETQNNDRLKQIAVGSKIAVAISWNGKIFNLPNKLDFENPRIVDLQAGREHCLLLDQDGNVYSFGRGSRGQLGHGNLEDEPEPKQIQALAGIKIAKISTGGWHSCAISFEGDLYVWGWNGNSQLGLEEDVSVMASPHVVDFEGFADSNVVSVACGNRHTIALLDDGKLFGCGWNKYRQLGIPCRNDDGNDNVHKMRLLNEFVGLNVRSLRCGPWSSAVIVE